MNDLGVPMTGVTLELYVDTDVDGNADGAAIQTTTAINGLYAFFNVDPGNYVVVEIQPNPYSSISDQDTSINASDLDGDDSIDGPDNDIPVFNRTR